MIKNACGIHNEKLYFLSTNDKPTISKYFVLINVDYELTYQGYFNDFGPVNLSCVFQFCQQLNKCMKVNRHSNKRIIHITSTNPKKKVNAAFMNGCYQIIHLDRTPQEAVNALTQKGYKYIMFRDAATGRPCFQLSLLNCLRGFYKAIKTRLFISHSFNVNEYDHYDNISNGDIHWIVPKKILAFTGPRSRSYKSQGYQYHTPSMYISTFHKWNVGTIIRLNSPEYNPQIFINAGISHFDLIFNDGGVPSEKLVQRFLKIVESTKGAVAVHCKAGLGRTGTLIGCYLMKHYKFTGPESIAWLRICRPGSVIGHQQNWLIDQEIKYGCQMKPKSVRDRKQSQSSIYSVRSVDSRQLDSHHKALSQPTTASIKYAGDVDMCSMNNEIPNGEILNCLKTLNRQITKRQTMLPNDECSARSESISEVILDYDCFRRFNRTGQYNTQRNRGLRDLRMSDNKYTMLY